MRWGLVSLKKQGHALPEAMVPDTVDNDITATVSCQDPEGKEGEVTPGVSHDIPEHKHCDGREGGCEGKCKDANRLGSFDVWEGRPVRAPSSSWSSSSASSISQTPLWEQFAFSGVSSDAGERHDVDGQRAAEQREVKRREQQQDVGVGRQLVPQQQRGVVAHATALIVLQCEVAAEDERRQGQQEAGGPREEDEEKSSSPGHQGVLVERPQDGHAALQRHEEDGADGDERAPGKHRANQHAGLPGTH